MGLGSVKSLFFHGKLEKSDELFLKTCLKAQWTEDGPHTKADELGRPAWRALQTQRAECGYTAGLNARSPAITRHRVAAGLLPTDHVSAFSRTKNSFKQGDDRKRHQMWGMDWAAVSKEDT